MLALKYVNEGHPVLGGNRLFDKWIVGISVPVSALSVLYHSTDIFLNQRHNEAIPDELREMLTPPLAGIKRKLHDAAILIGSAASLIPLAMVSIFYPLWRSIPFTVVLAVVVEGDNTVLHFLPLKLALTYPIYRFPILPFEFLIKKYCLKARPVQRDEISEITRQRYALVVNRAQQQLPLKAVFGRRRLMYRWEFTEAFKRCMKNPGNTDLLIALCEEFPKIRSARPEPISVWDNRLRQTSGSLGAFLVTGSLIGYSISAVLEILRWTGSGVGTFFVTAGPIYFLTVLLSFFGYNIGESLYRSVTRWGPDESKLPFELKLYPKFFCVVMVINLWLSLYSYAAAEELIHEWIPSSDQWAGLKYLLIWLSRIGLPLLSYFSVKDLTQTLLRKWAIHRGGENTQLAARLMTELEQLNAVIPLINPDQLSLSKRYLVEKGIIEDFSVPECRITKEVIEEQPHCNQQTWAQWLKGMCPCFWRRGGSEMEHPYWRLQRIKRLLIILKKVIWS